jgi:hypothetical protein
MDISATANLTIALFTVFTLSVFYQYVVLPPLMRSLLFRLFSKRDAVRKMAINGTISSTSKEYLYMQDFICRTIEIAPAASIWSFVPYAFCEPSANPDAEEFRREASPALLKLYRDIIEDVVLILAINSPIFSVFALLTGAALAVFGRIRSWMLVEATEGLIASGRQPLAAH